MHVAAINIYPIKSCAGIALKTSRLLDTGFEWDRHWMLVDPADRFVTQRELPQLATVVPHFESHELVVAAPGESDLSVPLAPVGKSHAVRLWRDRVRGRDCGDSAAAWFSRVSGRPLRLVAFDPALARVSNQAFTAPAVAHTEFADGYAVLVLSESSLEDLNSRLAAPLPMTRFRPNLVLRGSRAYQEDEIRSLQIGDVELRIVKPCERCKITTVDQNTGRAEGDEPLRTLRTYRYDRQLKGVIFGQNAIVMRGIGQQIAVGMPIIAH
ncbi:MAG: MOSC domain-containing protein [Pseudomonadales bacterium]|nr:MOSC domain-containing protein [Pseudomonadales bacterium]